jgi:High potential iron-sulfur protein
MGRFIIEAGNPAVGHEVNLMSDFKFDRRHLLKGALLGAVTLRALSTEEAKAAAALIKLTESDPTAKALGYHINAKTVDVKKYPTYKADQTCLNCVQLQAGTGNDRGCNLFAGKSVDIAGWCQVWVKKP